MTGLITVNVDLIITGVVMASMAVLGFTALMSDSRSVTAKSFFLFTMAGTIWSLLNYAFYHVGDPAIALNIMRMVICVAVWFVLFLFQFLYAFPKTDFTYPSWYRFFVVPAAASVSVVTLTPLVFVRVSALAPNGTIVGIENGPGIFVFVATVTALIFGGLLLFIHKMQRAPKESQPQYKPVLWGLFITFVLIITFNLLLPAFFNDSRFILYSALFILPTVVGAAYAIRAHHLFNIKVFSTAALVFLLSAASFGEILFSDTLTLILFRTGVFVFVLVFGINLIRSVIREVEQREKIEKLAKELEETNERQETLIHFIGHEVKGFLTKDAGTFASLSEGDFGVLPETLKPFVDHALAESRRGVDAVANILKAANLKKGTVAYAKESFDLKALVADAVEKAKPAAKEKGLALSFNADESSYRMTGDKVQIRDHVLRNLIDNAINYTPSGAINVSLKKENGKSVFMVQDSGIGITDEDKKRLFTEGGHGKESQKVNVHSTGYGLYIAKSIVLAHGGTIRAESEGAGHGSTFIVELPE
ncbi:HAMP domain-containing histidine kinase [Patescibacteria group bacterium]|nr:HAMP domain-containing histidine kinase [Patescibacteria group bacterium]